MQHVIMTLIYFNVRWIMIFITIDPLVFELNDFNWSFEMHHSKPVIFLSAIHILCNSKAANAIGITEQAINAAPYSICRIAGHRVPLNPHIGSSAIAHLRKNESYAYMNVDIYQHVYNNKSELKLVKFRQVTFLSSSTLAYSTLSPYSQIY